MKGDELIGEAEILNTPAGMTAKALVEGGVRSASLLAAWALSQRTLTARRLSTKTSA